MSILPMYKTKSSNMGLPNGPEARKSLALYGLTKGSMRRLYTSLPPTDTRRQVELRASNLVALSTPISAVSIASLTIFACGNGTHCRAQKTYLLCYEDCFADNDPIQLYLAEAVASLIGTPVPKEFLAALAELIGNSNLARQIRAGSRIGGRFTTIPSALALALRGLASEQARQVLRYLGRYASYVVVAYGNYLAILHIHCASFCWFNACYNPFWGRFSRRLHW